MNAYIHVPFCRSFCSYCDFTSFAGKGSLLPAYVGALLREIASSDLEGPLRTVYFGGGTPSLLEPADLGRMIGALREKAGLSDGVEISMEANPDTVDASRLEGFRGAGVTRLSLGAQTSHVPLLELLARRHDWVQVERAVRAARETGFLDVNLDLMIGSPGQTVPLLRETLQAVLSLTPDHLSVYALQLEPGTPLEEKVKAGLALPGDDETADQYEEVQRALDRAGFLQYEVSNWCRPGHECRHNLAVWQGEDYWGFGVSAVGTQGDRRRTNTRDLDGYLRAPERPDEDEAIGPREREFERLMLALRTSKGAPEDAVESWLNRGPSRARQRFEAFLREGWLVREGGRVRPGPGGYFRLNGILAEILD